MHSMTRNLFIGAIALIIISGLLTISGISGAAPLSIAAGLMCAAPAGIFAMGAAVGRGSFAAERVLQDASKYRSAVAQGKVRRIPDANQELLG
jgi:hypothetical protein